MLQTLSTSNGIYMYRKFRIYCCQQSSQKPITQVNETRKTEVREGKDPDPKYKKIWNKFSEFVRKMLICLN